MSGTAILSCLCGEYIYWLNKVVDYDWEGILDAYYGYDGGFQVWRKKKEDFKNNAIEITLEQWEKAVNKTGFSKGGIVNKGEEYLINRSMKEKFAANSGTVYIDGNSDLYNCVITEETINTNNMKYKLIKEEYLTAVSNILYGSTLLLWNYNDLTIEDPELIKKLKDAGVLHWFEEVNEYQIGDYITVVKECYCFNGKEGKTYKLIEISGDFLYCEGDKTITTDKVSVRKATPAFSSFSILSGKYNTVSTRGPLFLKRTSFISSVLSGLTNL